MHIASQETCNKNDTINVLGNGGPNKKGELNQIPCRCCITPLSPKETGRNPTKESMSLQEELLSKRQSPITKPKVIIQIS
mmetsp:Transcript_9962/g.14094  ORF Transcript_9962/g.14094 Transcript_9962/m.14094 type:complete len:80 (-) Transcript_9962:158-397(-)